MHFFDEYVKIKTEDRKIFVLTSESSPRHNKPSTRNHYKYKYTSKLLNFNIQVYLRRFLALSLYYFRERTLIKTRIL